MNVNVLKDNPDWRWFLLFVLVVLFLAITGWLTFKYTSVSNNFSFNFHHDLSFPFLNKLNTHLG